MPKRLTERGRRALRPRRGPVHKRFRGVAGIEEILPIMVGGKVLNIPETIIYKALEQMKIPFVPQVLVGGGRELGGAMVDFWLPEHQVVIEYQGPFHATDRGAAQDFIREVNRKRLLGVHEVVYIYEEDLDDIYNVIRERIGFAVRY